MLCVGSTTPQPLDKGQRSSLLQLCDVEERLDCVAYIKKKTNSYVRPFSSSSPTLRCRRRRSLRSRLVPVSVAAEVLGVKRNFADVDKVHVDSFMAHYRRQQRHVYIS